MKILSSPSHLRFQSGVSYTDCITSQSSSFASFSEDVVDPETHFTKLNDAQLTD